MLRFTLARLSASPRRREGVATVEFAVLAPFLVLIFVITLDFARVYYYQTVLEQCACNAAIYGSNLRSYQETTWVSPYSTSSTPSDDNIQIVATADGACLNPPLTTDQVTVAHANGSDGNAAVQVTINYTYSTITHFPGFGFSFNLQAKSSMRVAP
jgi:Flp pilus assembly protein TadG